MKRLASTVEVWDRLAADLSVIEGLAPGLDVVVLGRWIEYVDIRERAGRLCEDACAVDDAQGRVIRNPAWRVVKDCDKALAAIEDTV